MITSLQSPHVKKLVRLRDRRARDKSGTFIIEGYRELSRAKKISIEALYFSPEHFLGSNERKLIDEIASRGAEVFRFSKQAFAKVSYRDRPDGLIAIAQQEYLQLNELPQSSVPFFLLGEAIEKPGNLGTMLRSADAVGVDGVIVCDPKTDIFNPNVVRASVGTLFTQPVVQASTEETLNYLRDRGIAIVATTPHTKTHYTDVDLTGPIAVAAGTEQVGLSEKFIKQADLQVRIPMCGVADSLNVASATTLILYEVLRQRRNSLS
ncbi:MAG: RNA methyltransferase [Candidatus Algichlamydia australiensis]|nr:RNA methyltransferase [Chlamydiales bacterium]